MNTQHLLNAVRTLEVERIEDADQRDEDDRPEHGERDGFLDIHTLFRAFADPVINAHCAQRFAGRRACDDRDP